MTSQPVPLHKQYGILQCLVEDDIDTKHNLAQLRAVARRLGYPPIRVVGLAQNKGRENPMKK